MYQTNFYNFFGVAKISTVDEQRQIHIMRMSLLTGMDEDDGVATQDSKSAKSCASKYLQKKLSANDIEHIIRTTKLILKMNALSTEVQKIPKNIYHPSKPDISETLLDKSTYPIGHYLIKRYLCTNGILGLNEEDLPPITDIEGPKVLLNRVKTMKSVTINRGRCQKKTGKKLEHIRLEEKRQQKVKKTDQRN
ncbi:unnamed protein product [Mytilus coruscus]|uniref:Uncharacterized protein n=1 Tax=Mytilus coruscus TaxID=42192 RepID=A0A6J8A2X7_MYTCO|nr:unnamed protein product [Mytilus coruscus]